jgi:hypothetical protein
MNKTFYVVIPLIYNAGKTGLVTKFMNLLSPSREITITQTDFQKSREELFKRVNQVTSTLGGMGLKSITLSTEELIELMYNSYNLDTASPIKIKSVDDLDLAQANQ